jgi:drug/metabolite transporter (DMT)-like permease
MMPPRSRLPEGAAYLMLAAASLCWAGNHVTGRWIALEIPPVPPGGLSAVRWLLAALLLLPFSWRHLVADWSHLRERPGVVLFLGLLGGAAFSSIQFYGLRFTTAINVGVMNSVAPAFIILAGVFLFRDVVRASQLIGVAISLAGVLVILTRGDPGLLASISFNLGDLLVLGNMAIFAVYSAVLRSRPPMHWLTFMTLFSLIASAGSLPVVLFEIANGEIMQPTWATIWAVLYTGIFTSLSGYIAWNAGVAALGLQRAGPFLHLVPFFSALLSIMVIGEAPRPFHAVGLVLIIAGVSVAARAPAVKT